MSGPWRRREELRATTAGNTTAGNALAGGVPADETPAVPAGSPAAEAGSGPLEAAVPPPTALTSTSVAGFAGSPVPRGASELPKPASVDVDGARVAGVRVPATAVTVVEWANLWVRMCADGDPVMGPLNDDDRACAQYGLTAKQLRNVRNAATSGALRRKALALQVALPPEYVDKPADHRMVVTG